ncbi:MAG: DsrE family protein [Acetobacteraceae bacterium]
MKRIVAVAFGVLLAMAPMTAPMAIAGANDPLFVNTTTDEPHRSTMALTFAMKQQELKHPVTIFLNDRAVVLGSRAHASKFGKQQQMLVDLMKAGGTVLICPMCMQHYGVNKDDLLPGIKIGSPELTGGALFADNAKSLTW